MYVDSLIPACVFSYLVDAEVSHPEDNRAGHELGLGALGGRRTEGSAGRGAYLTCRERKIVGSVYREETKMGDKQSDHLVLKRDSSVPCKRCVSPHPAVRTHRGTWL